jgi:hypothetical protein
VFAPTASHTSYPTSKRNARTRLADDDEKNPPSGGLGGGLKSLPGPNEPATRPVWQARPRPAVTANTQLRCNPGSKRQCSFAQRETAFVARRNPSPGLSLRVGDFWRSWTPPKIAPGPGAFAPSDPGAHPQDRTGGSPVFGSPVLARRGSSFANRVRALRLLVGKQRRRGPQ